MTNSFDKEKNPRKLRPWLEKMIDSDNFPGLKWINDEKTIFRIPWKHAGKFSWREEDCLIFKAWAEHRGKYVEGVDKFDPATWKTRLRCALNKLPDVLERKDLSKLDGAEAFRVYELLPEIEKNDTDEIYPRHLWSKEAKERENEDERMSCDAGYQSHSPNSSHAEISNPDSPAASSDRSSTEAKSPRKPPTSPQSSSSSINGESSLRSSSSLQSSPTSSTVSQRDAKNARQILGTVSKNGQKIFVKAVLPPNLKLGPNLKKPFILNLPFAQAAAVRHVRFSIKYFGKEVFSWDTREKALCRLTSNKRPIQVKYPMKDFCEKKMTLVLLPRLPNLEDEKLREAASAIFTAMQYGLIIRRNNDDLVLYRLSKCRVFVVDDGNTHKLGQLDVFELNLKKRRQIQVYFGQNPDAADSRCFLSMQITT